LGGMLGSLEGNYRGSQHCPPSSSRYVLLCPSAIKRLSQGHTSKMVSLAQGWRVMCKTGFQATSRQTQVVHVGVGIISEGKCYCITRAKPEGIHKTARRVQITYTLEAMVQLTCTIVYR